MITRKRINKTTTCKVVARHWQEGSCYERNIIKGEILEKSESGWEISGLNKYVFKRM